MIELAIISFPTQTNAAPMQIQTPQIHTYEHESQGNILKEDRLLCN
jgi:hypothetical protein